MIFKKKYSKKFNINIAKYKEYSTFPPPAGAAPSRTTADLLVAVGIIRAMLSISLAEMKFCSSLRKY